MPRAAKPWFRVYSDLLDNPKIQRLKPPLFKQWVNLACLANMSTPRGCLPPVKDIAFRLRMAEGLAAAVMAELVALRLVDVDGDMFVMHDWADWQYESDTRETEGRSAADEKTSTSKDRKRSAAKQPTLRGDSAAIPPPLRGDVAAVARHRAEADTEAEKDTEPEPEPDARARELAAAALENRHWVLKVYEDSIGLVTPLIHERLIAVADGYPEGWVRDAFAEAKERGGKSLRYVEAILARWQTQGRRDPKSNAQRAVESAPGSARAQFLQRAGLATGGKAMNTGNVGF